MKNDQLKTLSNLPAPPYFAVIFTSHRSDITEAYDETAERMLELAALQAGYLGVDSARQGKTGITVSYWTDEKSILLWKQQMEHQAAQAQGKSQWYDEYSVRIAKVERSYCFAKGGQVNE